MLSPSILYLQLQINMMSPTCKNIEEARYRRMTTIHVIEANQDSSTGQHAKPDSYQCHGWFFNPELQTEEPSPAKAFFMDDGL